MHLIRTTWVAIAGQSQPLLALNYPKLKKHLRCLNYLGLIAIEKTRSLLQMPVLHSFNFAQNNPAT